jgi:hypothetical protein
MASAQQGMASVMAHRKGRHSQERLALLVWEVWRACRLYAMSSLGYGLRRARARFDPPCARAFSMFINTSGEKFCSIFPVESVCAVASNAL